MSLQDLKPNNHVSYIQGGRKLGIYNGDVKSGTYIDINGNFINADGFALDENGYIMFDKEGKPIKRGFIAKANAIFEFEKRLEEKNFHKKIMMSNITIKEFVEFLNLEFNLGIKYHPNYKLSSGEKHETVVKRFY